MAEYTVQYIKHLTTGLPEDDVVTTFHFKTNEAGVSQDTALDLAGHVAASHFNATNTANGAFLEQYISGEVSRTNLPDLRVYDELNPGSPIAETNQLSFRNKGSGFVDMPGEVSVCLSFRGAYGQLLEELGTTRPKARVRGRIYEGPLVAQTGSGVPVRPDSNMRAMLLDFADRLGDVSGIPELVAVNAQWVVWSRTNASSVPVVEAWVDNAYDTQRRRGVAPTSRDVRAIGA